ncbi:MAG: hypothetical protein IJ440_00805 [Alphaproteobacteria bacterium]|nr:hypothetical protein [Alphaproteobacteria bacterium]
MNFSSFFVLQIPDEGAKIGAYIELNKNGNILIVIRLGSAERSGGSMAATLAHEICHQIVHQEFSQQCKYQSCLLSNDGSKKI